MTPEKNRILELGSILNKLLTLYEDGTVHTRWTELYDYMDFLTTDEQETLREVLS